MYNSYIYVGRQALDDPGPAPTAEAVARSAAMDAAQRPVRPAEAAGVARRVVPIQHTGRGMSHKFVTHFDASIPAGPVRRGPSTGRGGAEGDAVVRRRPAGVWRAISRQSIDCPAPFIPGLWPFMAIYFILIV